MKSDAHNRAETLERGPLILSIDQFFKDTAIIDKLGKPDTGDTTQEISPAVTHHRLMNLT